MSYFGNWFGYSSDYTNKASENLKAAGTSASNAAGNAYGAVKEFASTKTALSGYVGVGMFETVAGKIISTDAAMQMATWGSALLGAEAEVGFVSSAVHAASVAIASNPVAALGAFAGVTILATNPELTKALARTAGDLLETGFNLAKALGNTTVAVGLAAAETVEDFLGEVGSNELEMNEMKFIGDSTSNEKVEEVFNLDSFLTA